MEFLEYLKLKLHINLYYCHTKYIEKGLDMIYKIKLTRCEQISKKASLVYKCDTFKIFLLLSLLMMV